MCARLKPNRHNDSQLIISRFLWAALQLENLCKQRSDFDIERELSSLPKGLNETYGRMIKQIHTQTAPMQRIAQKTFLWMNYSLKPVHCRAMSVAVAIDENCKSMEDLERKRYDEEAVIEACAGFLIVENGYFRLVHHSVFEYFMDPPEHMLDWQYSKYFSDSKSASSCLAKDCLSYMLLKDTDDVKTRIIAYDDPFFVHAGKLFDKYLQLSDEIPENMQNQLSNILSNSELCRFILDLRFTPYQQTPMSMPARWYSVPACMTYPFFTPTREFGGHEKFLHVLFI